MKYVQRYDGEVIILDESNTIKIVCCDCGLVHRLVFGTFLHKRKRRIAFAPYRDARATAQRRRHWKRNKLTRRP